MIWPEVARGAVGHDGSAEICVSGICARGCHFLEREEEKARKIRRLAELEGRNRERRRRIHEDAQALERPEPRGLPPAAEPRRQRTVNMADLRQDPHVDRRAGALLRTLSLVSDSDSEPDCVASDQRRRSTKRGRRLRSGMEARATDVVVNPQFWPHVALPLEQVGKSFAFAELDLRLLVAGELEIVTADSVSRCEKEGRLGLLKDVTYIAGNQGWQAAKNIYSAVVRKIELGLLQWDSDFSSVCQVVLLKAQHSQASGSRFNNKKAFPRGQDLPTAWFCRAYQSHSCEKKAPHDDVLPSGLAVSVEHFCAACYAKDKKKALHARTDAVCPHKTAWLVVDDNGGGSNTCYCVRNDTGPCACRLSLSQASSLVLNSPQSVSNVANPEVQHENIADRNVPDVSLQERYLYMHAAVQSSGRPNFQGCRFPVSSKFNIDFLRQESENYTDRDVIDHLQFGFPINSTGEYRSVPVVQNHKGARDFPEAVDKYLQKELSHHAVVGPFVNNPFPIPCNLNPLNSVPKRDSNERRIIVDLSFPKGDSVNATIPKNSYLGEPFHLTFPTVDALIAMVKHKGQGCALFKRDLQRAYRQIPVDPGDIHHLGYKWRGDLFFDVMLPMGLRSAALCCQRTTNLITHIARKWGLTVENYLDDFMGAETWDQAASSFQILGDVLVEAGLVEASDKACPSACVVVCLGIVFNTRELSLTITPDRLSEVLGILADWEGRMSASRLDLQVLLGKLHFVACCVRPGRVFVSRLLNFLRETPPVGKVSIPAEAQKDVAWWLKFMPLYNGVSMIPWEEWSVPDSVMSSDACLVGCGAWVEGQYFHAQFPDFILAHRPSINSLELLAIVVAIKLWGASWKGKRIRILCDNMVSVQVLNSGAARDEFLQDCLREICFFLALYEVELRAQHIAGIENRVADLCSRLHLPDHHKMFHECNKVWGLEPQVVSPELFKFRHLW